MYGNLGLSMMGSQQNYDPRSTRLANLFCFVFLDDIDIHDNAQVVWENVRVLKGSGETVSVDGTHLGHNLPDRKGNRYCINLVSVAGRPKTA